MLKKSLKFLAVINLVCVYALQPVIVHAGDGDVDYSAPYIMVDPETGELVTVNPGPELRMHSETAGPASTQTKATTDSEATASITPAAEPANSVQQQGFSFVNMTLIAGGLIALAVFVGRRHNRKQAN